MPGLFVTGTDTGVGKTLIAVGLIAALQQRGARVLGMKPVAAGTEPGSHGPCNADALALAAAGSSIQPLADINPFAFPAPVAPTIAAAEVGAEITLAPIGAAYRRLARQADWVVVEGVGGWRVPLAPGLSVADLPRQLQLPVVLVVGLRLGCLNHALLSAERIIADGLCLAGWIASQIDPDMLAVADNLACLRAHIAAPCLGEVPFLSTPSAAEIAARLDLTALFTLLPDQPVDS